MGYKVAELYLLCMIEQAMQMMMYLCVLEPPMSRSQTASSPAGPAGPAGRYGRHVLVDVFFFGWLGVGRGLNLGIPTTC